MIFDLHNDFPTAISADDYGNYLNTVGKDVSSAAVIWTSKFGENASLTVESIAEKLKNTDSELPIAIEDIGFLSENNSFAEFDFSRFIYCSLTWNSDNGFAGGALGGGELTELGKKAISVVNSCGCALDLAHLNKKSFYSALDSAEYVLCSHTGFNRHLRSLDDAQIRALVERKSLIGLCTVTAFTNAKNADEFTEVIDDFVQKYGVDALAIGTDFQGSSDIPSDISDYDRLAIVTQKLKDRGYTDENINKIFFKNAFDFFNRRVIQ